MQALDINTYLHKKLLDWKFPYTHTNHRFTNEKTRNAYNHLNCMDNHATDISHEISIAGKMISQTLLRETNERTIIPCKRLGSMIIPYNFSIMIRTNYWAGTSYKSCN